MTDLAKWLDARKGEMSRAAFARSVSISPAYLTELASGLKSPSLDVAFRIEKATGGAVTAASFLGREAAA